MTFFKFKTIFPLDKIFAGKFSTEKKAILRIGKYRGVPRKNYIRDISAIISCMIEALFSILRFESAQF